MPVSGGYFEQPVFVIEAFALLDGWMEKRRKPGEPEA